MKNDIVIYPNPVLNQLNIQTSSIKNYTVDIYTINGALVNSSAVSNNKSVNVSNLSAGLYVAKFIDPNTKEITIKKLIKK